MDIKKLSLDQNDFNVTFDGISDIADVASRFLTYVGNTLRSRLVSILKYLGPGTIADKLTPLVNKLLLLIQQHDQIPIGGDLVL